VECGNDRAPGFGEPPDQPLHLGVLGSEHVHVDHDAKVEATLLPVPHDPWQLLAPGSEELLLRQRPHGHRVRVLERSEPQLERPLEAHHPEIDVAGDVHAELPHLVQRGRELGLA
jgi:hypothetical protein